MAVWLYLVRHGETLWNTEGRLCGSSDVPLSAVGQQQAHQVAQRLRAVPLAAVYSSPLVRARQTAEIIAAPHGVPVQVVAALREIDYGAWEGMRVDELARRFPEAERCRTDDPLRFVAPDGEPFAHFVARVTAALQDIAARHADGHIAVVAHQGVNRVLLCWLLQADFALWRRLQQDPACVNLLQRQDNGQWRVCSINDVCHWRATTTPPSHPR